MKKLIIAAVVFASSVLTGCATVTSGTHQDVGISSTPAGAHFVVMNHNGGIEAQGITPATVSLKRGEGNYTVRVDKDGKSTSGSLTQGVNGWIWGNIAIGGLIGLGVDFIDGAAYRVTPPSLNVIIPNAQ